MELLESYFGWILLLVTVVVIFLYKKFSKNPDALTSKFEVIKKIDSDLDSSLLIIKQALKNTGFKKVGIDEDEFVKFSTGRKLRITLNSKIKSTLGSQQVTKHFIVTIKSRSILQPIIITDMTWNTL